MTARRIALSHVAAARSVQEAATVHHELMDRFMDRVRARLATTTDAFTRDSLMEMLGTLAEQRDGYPVLVLDEEPLAA